MRLIINQVKRNPLPAILGLALGLRLAYLGSESLWYDESFTAWLARLDLARLWDAVAGDVHPPLFYFIEWINVRIFGSGEFALRLPSAILGVVAVWLTWKIAHWTYGDRAGLIAAFLAAILPATVYYGQEARMYNLMAVGVLVAVLGLIRANWILLTVGGVIAVYSQNLALFYVAAIAILLVWLYWRESAQEMIKPAMALVWIAIPWLFWGRVMLGQAGNMSAGFWLHPLTPSGLVMPLASMTLGWRVGDGLQIPVYAVAIAMTLQGVRWYLINRKPYMWSLLVILIITFGAPILAALVSVVWRSVYLPRAFLPSSYLLCIVWAWGMTWIGRERRYASLFLVPALAAGLIAHYIPGTSGRFDARNWLQPVKAAWQPGDTIYYTAIHSAVWLQYYAGDLPYALRPGTGDLNQSLTDQTRAAMGLNQATFDAVARTARRAWLLTYTNPMTHRDEKAEIARILSSYPNTLIARKDATNAEMSIYLVQLEDQ